MASPVPPALSSSGLEQHSSLLNETSTTDAAGSPLRLRRRQTAPTSSFAPVLSKRNAQFLSNLDQLLTQQLLLQLHNEELDRRDQLEGEEAEGWEELQMEEDGRIARHKKALLRAASSSGNKATGSRPNYSSALTAALRHPPNSKRLTTFLHSLAAHEGAATATTSSATRLATAAPSTTAEDLIIQDSNSMEDAAPMDHLLTSSSLHQHSPDFSKRRRPPPPTTEALRSWQKAIVRNGGNFTLRLTAPSTLPQSLIRPIAICSYLATFDPNHDPHHNHSHSDSKGHYDRDGDSPTPPAHHMMMIGEGGHRTPAGSPLTRNAPGTMLHSSTVDAAGASFLFSVPTAGGRAIRHGYYSKLLADTSGYASPAYSDAYYLDDPEVRERGKRRAMHRSYVTTVVHYLDKKNVKKDVNRQFYVQHPELEPLEIKLSHLRSIKVDLLPLVFEPDSPLELATIAHAVWYLERLILKQLITKANRKAFAAACVVLAIKFCEVGQVQKKVTYGKSKLQDIFHVSHDQINEVEMMAFVGLDFSLLAPVFAQTTEQEVLATTLTMTTASNYENLLLRPHPQHPLPTVSGPSNSEKATNTVAHVSVGGVMHEMKTLSPSSLGMLIPAPVASSQQQQQLADRDMLVRLQPHQEMLSSGMPGTGWPSELSTEYFSSVVTPPSPSPTTSPNKGTLNTSSKIVDPAAMRPSEALPPYALPPSMAARQTVVVSSSSSASRPTPTTTTTTAPTAKSANSVLHSSSSLYAVEGQGSPVIRDHMQRLLQLLNLSMVEYFSKGFRRDALV